MGSRSSFALLLPLAALLGCAGGGASNSSSSNSSSSGSSTSATQAPYNFNGSWKAFSFNNPANFPFSGLQASLQVSNGSVIGTILPYSNYATPDPCSANNQSLPVTGSLDAAHDLTLTFPIAGGTGTLLATLADDPQTYVYGSWQVSGGTCAMSTTQMVISQTIPTTPPTSSSTPTITANLSGDWGISAVYTPPNANFQYAFQPVGGFLGTLQFTNGTVSGTLTPQGPIPCTFSSPTPVTGTIDANNNLVLTVPVDTGTATITATLGINPQTLAVGSFTIAGGTGGFCSMPATPMTIAQFAAVAGRYTGTFTVPDSDGVPYFGTNITLTVVLSQSSTANASGAYPVTGTFTVSGSCTDSGSFTGMTVEANLIGSSSPRSLYGLIDPTASSIIFTTFASANCSQGYFGTLIRQ